MEKLSELVIDYVMKAGACSAGIATIETLAGGPISTDLSREMEGAKSAIVFALPQNQELIPDYLAKKNRLAVEEDFDTKNSIASGIAVKLASFLRAKGHPAVALAANDDFDESTPNGAFDQMPLISLRYLAVAAGVGWFGWSGNVITKENGAAVVLGALLTSTELVPTPPLKDEDNFCDDCMMCAQGCPSGLMDKTEMTEITMGGRTFSYSKRNHYMRCQYVCGGMTGLPSHGRWSTWSPGRFDIPETDEEILPLFIGSIEAYNNRPQQPGGHPHPLLDTDIYVSCANCQYLCVPEKDERNRRFKLLAKGGVVVQKPDGTLEAVKPKEGKARLEAMEPERRGLYESVSEIPPELIPLNEQVEKDVK